MKALVMPGRLALLAQQRANAGNVQWGGQHLFTWEGRHSLMRAMLRDLPPAVHPLLSEAAAGLLTMEAARGLSLFQGIAASMRLPHKLWRLLLQIKSSGLSAAHLKSEPDLAELGQLLDNYQKLLEKNQLGDQADDLNRLLAYLREHGLPPAFAGYNSLEVRDSLWLRPMDIRLLLALRPYLSINLQFALPDLGNPQYTRLLDATARTLEEAGDLEISWPDLSEFNDMGQAARALMCEEPFMGANIDAHVAAGLYSEVEYLLLTAREQIKKGGYAPSDIVMVFPDLSLYGQLAEEVAGRLGLPLAFRRSQPLTHSPLYQALYGLLQLPEEGWECGLLIRVLNNGYLNSFFNSILKQCKFEINNADFGQMAVDLKGLLNKISYIDSHEEHLPQYLRAACTKLKLTEYEAELCEKSICFFEELFSLFNNLTQKNTLTEYINTITSHVLLHLLPNIDEPLNIRPGLDSGRLLARDLQTWQSLQTAFRDLSEAGKQVAYHNDYSGLLNVMHQFMGTLNSGETHSQGILLSSLEDAMGLKPRLLLAGGLNHGAFPRQPDPFVLSPGHRHKLGLKANMPVWRGEDEEYYGQQLRLNLLLAHTREKAVFTCSQADSNGQPLTPSIWFKRLVSLSNRKIDDISARQGVYGPAPELEVAQDMDALKLAIVYNLRGQGGRAGLARAVLKQLNLPEPVLRSPNPGLAWPKQGLFLLRKKLNENFRRLSISAIDTYQYCHTMWFFSYMAKLGKDEAATLELDYRDDGIIVHYLLAEFFNPQTYVKPTDRESVKQRLHQIWQQMESMQHSFIMEARKQVFVEQALRVIENEETYAWWPKDVEYQINLPVIAGVPMLTGRIDQVDESASALRVTDYKNSPNAVLKDYLPDKDGVIEKHQLLLYLAGMVEQTSKQTLEARIVNTKNPEKSKSASFARDHQFLHPGQDEDNIYQRIKEIWAGISNGDFTPTSDIKKCRDCAFKYICHGRGELSADD